MSARVRDYMLAALFAILGAAVGIVGWKLVSVLDRVENTLVLTEGALGIGRSAMAEQRIYYRALSVTRTDWARLAESHRRLNELAGELQRTANAGTDAIQQVDAASAALANQLDAVSGSSQKMLAEGTGVLTALNERLNDPSVAQTSADLAQSSANLERMSAAAADSAERVREILNPKTRTFWMRLLKLMIPRPTV